MDTIFVKEKDFNPKNYKGLEHFPNRYFKRFKENGKLRSLVIIPNDNLVTVKNLSKKAQLWHGARDNEVVELNFNGGNFPTEIIAGVEGGRFTENHPKSKKFGYIQGNGTLGTANELVLKSKVSEAVKELKRIGYNVKYLNNEVESSDVSDIDRWLSNNVAGYF